MKSTFAHPLLLSALLSALASTSHATTWYYDAANAASTVNFSQTGGDADTDGLWYTLEGETKVYIRNALPGDGDEIILGDGTNTAIKTLNMDTDATFASLTYNSGVGLIGQGSTKLTIEGNVTQLRQAQLTLNNFDLHIMGDFIGYKDGFTANLSHGTSVRIDGNVDGATFMNLSATGDSTLDNPNIVIGGAILHKDARISLNTAGADSYYSIGGLSGGYARVTRGVSGEGTSHLVLTNTSDYTYGENSTIANYNTGGRYTTEANIPAWNELGELKLYMKGTAKQTIQAFARFSGGVQVASGELRIRFNQGAEQYTYYTDSEKTKLVTFWTQANGGTQTTFTHGDLEMVGGKFGNEEGTACASFRFTNIVYSGGTIAINISSEENVNDSIDLTSYYKKVAESGQDDVYTKVDGGTISLAEGVAGGTKVTFEFSGDVLGWLLDYEDGSFEINDGKGARIVSWDAENKTALLASDFVGNWITQGDDYMPVFTVADDGLYVKYVAVPEPAEVAAILGALALTAAALRRRGRK